GMYRIEIVGYYCVAPSASLIVVLPCTPAHAVERHDAGLLQEFGGGGQHSAFGGRQVLCGVEAERHRIRPRADRLAAKARRERVRRVLDEREVMGARDRLEHVA